MSLAHVVENDGTLVVTQSNEPALRDLRTALIMFVSAATSLPLYYLFFSQIDGSLGFSWGPVSPSGQATPPPLGFFLFLSFPIVWMVIRSVNRLFSKETFIFDKNQGVFIRNGFTVGPLREIRGIKAQVTKGSGQNPMFRLALELPRCQTIALVTTHYFPVPGEFHLSNNGFSDPNKKFAVFEPWLDCDQQNLVPFVPPEIVELQQQIVKFVCK